MEEGLEEDRGHKRDALKEYRNDARAGIRWLLS